MRNRFPSLGLVLVAMLGLCERLPAADPPATQAEPFAKEIAAFEEADQKRMPPTGANLFVGSSSIRLWKTLAEDFAGRQVINRGFGGSQIADCVKYVDRIVIPYKPARIFFYAGDNDLNAGKSVDKVEADYHEFERKVHAALPDVDLYFISAKPSPSRVKIMEKDRELNRRVEQFAKQHPHNFYIDGFTPLLDANGQPRPELFVADMLHMNPKGYAIWTGIIGPLVK